MDPLATTIDTGDGLVLAVGILLLILIVLAIIYFARRI